MNFRFPVSYRSAVLVAGLLALGACSGADADADADGAQDAPATSAEVGGDASSAPSDSISTNDASAASAATPADSGPGEFKETVKTARCKVYDPGGDYEGPCQFTQWEGGSFMVNREANAEFFNGITEVVVEVDAPGIAGGSIRQGGESNFLGTMERHSDDRACWSSADFTVCAY